MCSFVHNILTEMRKTDGWTDGWTNGWTNRQTDRCFAGKSLSKNGVSQLNRGFECKRSIIFSLSYSSFTTEATIVIKQTQKLLQHLGTRLWQICVTRQIGMCSCETKKKQACTFLRGNQRIWRWGKKSKGEKREKREIWGKYNF